MLIERLDMFIKEKESHVGIGIKKESLSSYHSTRNVGLSKTHAQHIETSAKLLI